MKDTREDKTSNSQNDSRWRNLIIQFSNKPLMSVICIVILGIIILIVNQLAYHFGNDLPISLVIDYSDSINFWASVITLIGTLFLGTIAFIQNQELIKINRDFQKIQVLQTEELIPFIEISGLTSSDFSIISEKSEKSDSKNVTFTHIIDEQIFKKEYQFTLKNSCKSKINSFLINSSIQINPKFNIAKSSGMTSQKNFGSKILFPDEEMNIFIVFMVGKESKSIFENEPYSIVLDLHLKSLTGFSNKEVISIDFGSESPEILYRPSDGFSERKVVHLFADF